MNKTKQMMKAQALLQEAIQIVSQTMPDNQTASEARSHMKQALGKISKITEKQIHKKEIKTTENQKWWDKVVAGTANKAMSAEVVNKNLEALNKMIVDENKALEDLDKKSIENPKGSNPEKLITED